MLTPQTHPDLRRSGCSVWPARIASVAGRPRFCRIADDVGQYAPPCIFRWLRAEVVSPTAIRDWVCSRSARQGRAVNMTKIKGIQAHGNRHGEVSFNSDKGYGFIAPDDGTADVFVPLLAIARLPATGQLDENQKVEFDTTQERGGDVRPL